MKRIAIILGILACVIGFWSAITALSAVGADPAYTARLWAGWASLALAILAGIAAILIYARPIPVSLIMLISGILGFICMNLFFINTWYMFAIPLWFLSTILAFTGTDSSTSKEPGGAS